LLEASDAFLDDCSNAPEFALVSSARGNTKSVLDDRRPGMAILAVIAFVFIVVSDSECT
jgi:hypothetical protein